MIEELIFEELRDAFYQVFDWVEAGEKFTIIRDDKPVAVLMPYDQFLEMANKVRINAR
jgi:antitoxin (DNA-binding transcriptional repressor) of toxin-antitoxin stability system